MWQSVWEASCFLASPGGTMNFGTTQPLWNLVSDVYRVLSKRHSKAKVTHIFVLIVKTLSLAAVGLEIWYVQFLHRFGSPENPGPKPFCRRGLLVCSSQPKAWERVGANPKHPQMWSLPQYLFLAMFTVLLEEESLRIPLQWRENSSRYPVLMKILGTYVASQVNQNYSLAVNYQCNRVFKTLCTKV